MIKFYKNFMAIACCTLLLSACSNVFYPKANALEEIRQGMSPKQVTNLLGKPDYRRINYDLEEWEYRKMTSPLDSEPTVIIVRFEDERLVYMDSYKESGRPQKPRPPRH